MSGLEPESRAFLREALNSDRPRAEDRARVRAMLAVQLGSPSGAEAGSAPASASTSVATTAGAKAIFSLVAGIIVTTSIGAAFLYSNTRAPVSPPLPTPAHESSLASAALDASPPVSPVARTEARSDDGPSAIVQASRSRVQLPKRVRARAVPPEPANRLAEEAALMAKIQLALRRGAAARALALAEEHRQRFPEGSLVAERWGARGLALCALGRTAEARASRSELVAIAPSSPLLQRLDAACGFDAGSDQ